MADREVTLSDGMVISCLDVGAPDGDVVLYFHPDAGREREPQLSR